MGKVLGDTSDLTASLLAGIGDRLGLFKDLKVNGPATSAELAARTSITSSWASNGAYTFLHLVTDQRLDGGTVQPLPSRPADLLVQIPAPQGAFHLVVIEDHEVKRLRLSTRGLLVRTVLDPHRGAREPEMLDDLGGDLLGSVDDGGAGVIGKLGADYDGGIPILLGEVQADAATGADSD